MSEGKIASIGVESPEPAASASKYDRLIAEAKRSAAAKAIVVHPCDETSLRGAVEAAAMGLISATLVGPAAKINNVAREHNLDIGKCEACRCRSQRCSRIKGGRADPGRTG